MATVCDLVLFSISPQSLRYLVEGHGSDGVVIEDGATFLRERAEEMVHDDV